MIFDTLILVDISTNVNMRLECCEPLLGGVLEEEGATRAAALFAHWLIRSVSGSSRCWRPLQRGGPVAASSKTRSGWHNRPCPTISASCARPASSLERGGGDGSTTASYLNVSMRSGTPSAQRARPRLALFEHLEQPGHCVPVAGGAGHAEDLLEIAQVELGAPRAGGAVVNEYLPALDGEAIGR